MADNVAITAGSGTTMGADEVVDGTLGTVKVGFGKIMDGTLDGTAKLKVTANNAAQVEGAIASGATNAANPVKVGGKYNSAGVTLTNGQGGDLQLSSKGELSTFSPDSAGSGTISAADAVVAAPGGVGATVTGASTAGSLVALQCQGGDSSWIMQVSGTFGGTVIYWEGSLDSTTGTDGTWINILGRQTGVTNTVLSGSASAAGVYRGNTSGWTWIRARAVGGSGITVVVKQEISSGTGAIFLNASIPAGTNAIGGVTNLPTTVDTNSGVKSASTLRVVLATDQPALTNKLLVTPDLPSGASTAAKQPALGTAGSASADVLTVQGITSMTPLVTSNTTTSVVGNGAAATAQRVTLANDSTGIIATVGAVTAITNALPAGSNALGSVSVTGTVVVDDLAASATGAAVPANAQYTGNLAQTALPSAATAGNLTGNLSDKFGRQVIITNGLRDLTASQTTTISSSTSETTIITAIASTFNDLTAIMISNTSATAVRVDLRDTTAGSVVFSIYIPAGDVRGISMTSPWPQSGTNTNWTAQSSASVADLRIACQYIKNK